MIHTLLTLLGAMLLIHTVVILHELGHDWAARKVGISATQLAIGFGPTLWHYQRQDGCRVALKLLPLGGYVTLNPNHQSQQPWAHIWILLAGPLSNVLWAWLTMMALMGYGYHDHKTLIGHITPGSVAAQSGLQPNTLITHINQHPVRSWHDMIAPILTHLHTPKPLTLRTTTRNGHRADQYHISLAHLPSHTLNQGLLQAMGIQPYQPDVAPILMRIDPDSPAAKAQLQPQDRILAIAGQPVSSWQDVKTWIENHANQTVVLTLQRHQQRQQQSVTLGNRLSASWQRVGYLGAAPPAGHWPADALQWVQCHGVACLTQTSHTLFGFATTMLRALQMLLTGALPMSLLSGPIGIANLAFQSVNSGLFTLLHTFVLLNIMVATLNLLPLPGLDGGQIMMHLIGLIRRRPIADRWQTLLSQWTWIALLVLVVQLTIRDIEKMQPLPQPDVATSASKP